LLASATRAIAPGDLEQIKEFSGKNHRSISDLSGLRLPNTAISCQLDSFAAVVARDLSPGCRHADQCKSRLELEGTMTEQPVDALTMFHRTLGRRPIKTAGGLDLPSDVLGSGYGMAYTFEGSAYVAKFYVPLNDGRNFRYIATSWEWYHSKLCYMPTARLEPVIDANILVVGHRGIFDSSQIYVKYPRDPRSSAFGDADLGDLLDQGIEMVADMRGYYQDQYFSQGYRRFVRGDQGVDVVADTDGTVHAVLAQWNSENAQSSWLQPADLIEVPKLIATLIGLGLVNK
jgi:hypothetical protein